MTSRQVRIAAVMGAALCLSYAYFYGAGGWNQNSRFAMIRAILERHTLQIDAYQLHTGDRALWRGHYYSDKAPGASLLALAPALLGMQAGQMLHQRIAAPTFRRGFFAGLLQLGVYLVIERLA